MIILLSILALRALICLWIDNNFFYGFFRYGFFFLFLSLLKVMVLNRISNIFVDIENENTIRRIDMFLDAQRIQTITVNDTVEIENESFLMDIENEQEFGLECECGHIEVGVWENRECSSCGTVIDIGNIEFDATCFQ